MPSASTNRPMSASVPIMSSLCSRTLPVSVSATLEIFPRKLMSAYSLLDSCRSGQSWRPARYARPTLVQGGGHLGAGIEPRIGILCQRTIDDALDAGREIGPNGAQRRMRRFGDPLHQTRHRIGGEWQLAGQELKQANTQGKQVRVTGHSS